MPKPLRVLLGQDDRNVEGGRRAHHKLRRVEDARELVDHGLKFRLHVAYEVNAALAGRAVWIRPFRFGATNTNKENERKKPKPKSQKHRVL